jgi:hypothetical protein
MAVSRIRKSRAATVVWGIIGLMSLALEVWTLRDRDKGDTLTEHVRSVVGTPKDFQWWLLAGFLVWLDYHFLIDRGQDV